MWKVVSIINIVDSHGRRFQQKIDSLLHLQMPAIKFTNKLDSLEAWKSKRLNTLASRVDLLKGSVRKKIESLEPPEFDIKANEPVAQFGKLHIDLPSTSLPPTFQQKLDVAMPTLPDVLDANTGRLINLPYSRTIVEVPSGGYMITGQTLESLNSLLPLSDAFLAPVFRL